MGIKQFVRTVLGCSLLFCILFGASGPISGAVISPGTPTTTVPTYLSDGTYPFGIVVTLAPSQFLLPVEISDAANLQSWQFDLLFDASVVAVVDPFDGTSGIYGAQFTPGDPSSLSFIASSGFLLDGRLDDVAGNYPSLLTGLGPSGDGTLAYVLFERLQDGEPDFSIDGALVFQVPEPNTLALLLAVILILPLTRAMHSNTKRG